jgi:hypothetical protein
MLLLQLVGATKETITLDYMLTRVGIEREREFLNESLRNWLGDDAMNQPGVFQMGSITPRVADEFQDQLAEKRGGAKGYLKKVLGLGAEDIAVIADNIRRKK